MHQHQRDALATAAAGESYVVTTGTGSGKSLTYYIPIVDRIVREGSGKGVRAIVVYPMNALANSQMEELKRFLHRGFGGKSPVTFERYTGQESREKRDEILKNPPDIILTNYMMLELMLVRPAGAETHHLSLQGPLLPGPRRTAHLPRSSRLRRGDAGAASPAGHRRTQHPVHRHLRHARGSRHARRTASRGRRRGLPRLRCHRQAVLGHRRDPAASHQRRPSTWTRSAHRIDTAPPTAFADLHADPLAVWIEDTFGITEKEGRLVRAQPRTLEQASSELADLTGADPEDCATAIRATLMAGAGEDAVDPTTGKRLFAFKLHQFISRGDTVYQTLARRRGPLVHHQEADVQARRPRQPALPAGVLPRVRPGVPARCPRRLRRIPPLRPP